MAKPRGRTIDNGVIEVIEHLLDQWTGKLTWDLLIIAIKKAIATEYTRQALSNHERVAHAFSQRKTTLAKEKGRSKPSDERVQGLSKTIDILKAENARLTNECNRYRARFLRWTQNALIKGLTEEQLDAPLPPVLRGSTEEKVVPMNKRRKNFNGK